MTSLAIAFPMLPDRTDDWRRLMTELEHAPPQAVDAALRAYRYEGRRLIATERAVDLVEPALRGESVTSQL